MQEKKKKKQNKIKITLKKEKKTNVYNQNNLYINICNLHVNKSLHPVP